MIKSAVFVAGAFCIAGTASATTYNDAVGNHLTGGDLHDFFQSQGFDHLDIVSVDITNDTQFLYIDVTANADLDATNWGKYVMGINSGLGNPTDIGNGWGRNIDWNGQSIDYWIGTWADEGGTGMGGELRNWNAGGGTWDLMDATYTTGKLINGSDAGHAAGVQHIVVDYTSMGLSIGDTFTFDVATTGGGGTDPGVDHLSRSAAGDWATDDWANTSLAGQFLSYTIIPTPGSLALLGLGGLGLVRRRR